MVGDGINDAPALPPPTSASRWPASRAADAPMQAAGITLMRGDPALVAQAIEISRAPRRRSARTCSGPSSTKKRGRHSAGGLRRAQPGGGRRGDGDVQRQRAEQRAAAAGAGLRRRNEHRRTTRRRCTRCASSAARATSASACRDRDPARPVAQPPAQQQGRQAHRHGACGRPAAPHRRDARDAAHAAAPGALLPRRRPARLPGSSTTWRRAFRLDFPSLARRSTSGPAHSSSRCGNFHCALPRARRWRRRSPVRERSTSLMATGMFRARREEQLDLGRHQRAERVLLDHHAQLAARAHAHQRADRDRCPGSSRRPGRSRDVELPGPGGHLGDRLGRIPAGLVGRLEVMAS